MSKLQIKKIDSLQKQIRDFNERLEFECFDCGGRQIHGPGWDCQVPNCSLYEIRPKTIYYKRQVPNRFAVQNFLVVERKPAKKRTTK